MNTRSPEHAGGDRRLSRAAAAAAAAVLVAAAAGCDREQAAGGGFSPPPMVVETALVESGEVVDRFTAVGSLAADDAITVVAEIDGIVAELPFREGQPVAAGDLILRLDDAELRAQVARAEAVRDQRRSTHERVLRVVEQGAGAPQDLDDAAAALKVADAELSLARARLAKTRVTAPFPGLTGARRVSPGAFIRAGTPVTDLAAVDELRVNFTVPERIVSRLRVGAPVNVATTAYPDLVLDGTIDVVEPVLDPATRSARVVARVPNLERLLRPGMSADVAVVLGSRSQALTVPSEAVFMQTGQTLVYVVQPDSTVAPQPVTLGLRQPGTVEVLSGLEAGVRVVRTGHQKLFPGARVVPVDSRAMTGSPPTAPGGPPESGREEAPTAPPDTGREEAPAAPPVQGAADRTASAAGEAGA
ncbi:MAG: efflux RND transporter periplasmic adaptor subunit [Candidatus Krumholzibacteriia bacterium]